MSNKSRTKYFLKIFTNFHFHQILGKMKSRFSWIFLKFVNIYLPTTFLCHKNVLSENLLSEAEGIQKFSVRAWGNHLLGGKPKVLSHWMLKMFIIDVWLLQNAISNLYFGSELSIKSCIRTLWGCWWSLSYWNPASDDLNLYKCEPRYILDSGSDLNL